MSVLAKLSKLIARGQVGTTSGLNGHSLPANREELIAHLAASQEQTDRGVTLIKALAESDAKIIREKAATVALILMDLLIVGAVLTFTAKELLHGRAASLGLHISWTMLGSIFGGSGLVAGLTRWFLAKK